MKKFFSMLLALVMLLALAGCGGDSKAPAQDQGGSSDAGQTQQGGEPADTGDAGDAGAVEDYHIGIVTGSVSQSEDDRRGAEAFQAKYGEDKVTLAIYPDNFTEELETTIQTIVNMSDDPLMKAVIVNQSIPGTTEAFRQIKERRPDILCIAGEAHEDLPEIGSAADLVCNLSLIHISEPTRR